METRKIKTGVAYEYSTGGRYRTFGSKGAMFLLTKDVYRTVRRPRLGELPFAPCPSGKAGYMEESGILVIHVRNAGYSEAFEAIRKVVSKVTLAQVEAAGMQIPAAVLRKIDKLDENMAVFVTVVKPRYLKGDWDTLRDEHEAEQAAMAAYRERAKDESAAREARWEEVSRVMEALTGKKPFYFVPTGEKAELRLGDVEELIKLAKAALPLLRAEDAPADV